MSALHFDCDGCAGIELVERGVVVMVACTQDCTCAECIAYRASVEAERDERYARRAAEDDDGGATEALDRAVDRARGK